MRQIETMEYSCPVCAADLICQAVDFSYDNTNGENTKTSYQCIGCGGVFYSIEQAYVAEPDKTPEFICPYCKQQADYLSLKDDWTDYWKCPPCKVSFQSTYRTDWKDVDIINMYTTIKTRLYVLRQFLSLNRSRVDMLPADPEDTVVIACDFDFLLPNVLPSNIHEKLLTYLVFS
jgi:DNA-directed RNA polymerase subunit RPC12/RpoP